MKRKSTIHPVLRAQMRAKWASEIVNAQIHALIGENKDKLLAYGSVLMFVASACAAHMGTSDTDVRFRIIQGSINALDDLKSKPAITPVDRGSIYAGLIASEELIGMTPIDVVDDAVKIYQRMEQELGMS